MSDPRELLDDLRHELIEDAIPRYRDAIHAVLDLHQPQQVVAFARTGGQCVHCPSGAPIKVEDASYKRWHMDQIQNIGREQHYHNDLHDPKCSECVDSDDWEPAAAPWPCPTVQAITKALGGEQ